MCQSGRAQKFSIGFKDNLLLFSSSYIKEIFLFFDHQTVLAAYKQKRRNKYTTMVVKNYKIYILNCSFYKALARVEVGN